MKYIYNNKQCLKCSKQATCASYARLQAKGIRHGNNVRKSLICRTYLLRLSKYTGEGAKRRNKKEKGAKKGVV